MKHMLTESSSEKRLGFIFWMIAALVAGTLTGGISWYQGCRFIPYFAAGTGFILSCRWIIHITEKGLPVWIGIEQYCNRWRLTRAGILLYGAKQDAPTIFLPWYSLSSTTHSEIGILIDTEDCLTFLLPADSRKAETTQPLIAEQIAKHRKEYSINEESPVYLQRTPERPGGIPKFLKVGFPWLIAGVLLPFILQDAPGSAMLSALSFAIGASFVLFGHSDFLDEYEAVNHLGNNLRHTKRGLHIQGLAGWHYFQPWAGITECFELDTQEYFLKLYGDPMGINIRKEGRYLPLPVARFIKVRVPRWRTIMNFAIVFLFAAAGFVWWACWS